MGCETGSRWGAMIERGLVRNARKDNDDIYRYTVESYDRPGVTALDLPYSKEVKQGSDVYFFMFPDGKGAIVAEALYTKGSAPGPTPGPEPEDTGWLDLELTGGSVWGPDDLCQIRKIGNRVFIRGAVKTGENIASGAKAALAKLPAGFRPDMNMKIRATSATPYTKLFLEMAANGDRLELRNSGSDRLMSGRYVSIAWSYTV